MEFGIGSILFVILFLFSLSFTLLLSLYFYFLHIPFLFSFPIYLSLHLSISLCSLPHYTGYVLYNLSSHTCKLTRVPPLMFLSIFCALKVCVLSRFPE